MYAGTKYVGRLQINRVIRNSAVRVSDQICFEQPYGSVPEQEIAYMYILTFYVITKIRKLSEAFQD